MGCRFNIFHLSFCFSRVTTHRVHSLFPKPRSADTPATYPTDPVLSNRKPPILIDKWWQVHASKIKALPDNPYPLPDRHVADQNKTAKKLSFILFRILFPFGNKKIFFKTKKVIRFIVGEKLKVPPNPGLKNSKETQTQNCRFEFCWLWFHAPWRPQSSRFCQFF